MGSGNGNVKIDEKNKTTISGEREHWLDAVRGIAVIFVLYAHSLPFSMFEGIISTFHVPLFVVVTGYLIGDKNFNKSSSIARYKRTYKKYVVPYFLYALIAIIPMCIINYLIDNLSWTYIISNLYGTIIGYGGSFALWFVASCLIGLGLYSIIRCNFQKCGTRWIIAVISLVIALIYDFQISGWIAYKVDLSLIFWIEYPIITILRSFTFVFYFEVGSWMKQALKELSTKKILVVLIAFVSAVLMSIVNGDTNYSVLNHGKYPFVLYFCGATGAVAFLVLFKLIYQKCRIKTLEFTGKHSLMIMSTHMNWGILFFTQVFINNILFRCPENRGFVFQAYGIICVIIMMIVETVMIQVYQNIKIRRRL